MRILVTGGAGFIGSHVVDLYIESGHQVSVVDNLSSGCEANIHAEARFYEMDIRSDALNRVFEKERPQVVNHHAAQIDIWKSSQDPSFDADVNILGSINVARCCLKTGTTKFIFASSGGAIYGEPAYLPCDEDHPIRPVSPYAVSKYAFELYLALPELTGGMQSIILRYPNVYGPRQTAGGEAGVVAIFSSRMLKDQAVTIFGSGEQTRDFTYVEDCARGNLKALEHDASGTFNLGTGIGTSINTLFERMKAITDYTMEPEFHPARPGDIGHSTLDASLAQRKLGWRAGVDLEAGLVHTIHFLKDRLHDQP